MKIALQLGLIPGTTVRDKASWARDHGAEGLELGVWGGGLERCRRDADEIGGILPISSVCGNADLDGNPCFDFLDPDREKRRRCLDGSKALLSFCGEVGAAGQIVPPIFGGPKVPDLAPYKTAMELEDGLMDAALSELGPLATAAGTHLLLEPLNRYEQHYLRKLSDGVRAIERAGASGVALLADLFHMHIEETDSPQALKDAAGHVRHLHLADNTRMEPGTGDIDFQAAFRALKEIGFTGWMAYECGVTGAADSEKAKNLARSLEFVRDAIQSVSNG
jgi:sugar phosphate isomerase/epimerase